MDSTELRERYRRLTEKFVCLFENQDLLERMICSRYDLYGDHSHSEFYSQQLQETIRDINRVLEEKSLLRESHKQLQETFRDIDRELEKWLFLRKSKKSKS